MPSQTPSSPEEVARAHLLADQLKEGPFTPDGFRSRIAESQTLLSGYAKDKLFSSMTDAQRRKRIESGTWVFTVITLDQCSVWERMGATDKNRREWAKGPVNRVASELQRKADPENKVWAILRNIRMVFAEFPLIIIRSTGEPSRRFRIDDGSHRAVAYYLAGFRHAFAYVGTVPSHLNLTWNWSGLV